MNEGDEEGKGGGRGGWKDWGEARQEEKEMEGGGKRVAERKESREEEEERGEGGEEEGGSRRRRRRPEGGGEHAHKPRTDTMEAADLKILVDTDLLVLFIFCVCPFPPSFLYVFLA